MRSVLEQEIERFKSFAAASTGSVSIECPAEYCLDLLPKGQRAALPGGKPVGITFIGLVHGNEVAGLRVINDVLELITRGVVVIDLPLSFIIGNPWAALEGKRFRESDLNRSFGVQYPKTFEQKRAEDLRPLLQRTNLLLDLHQTRLPATEPFFIFPCSAETICFAAAISRSVPIVTHWGESFSKDGQCTDEFTNAQGGVGITVELGEAGFGSYEVGVGVHLVLSAVAAAEGLICARAEGRHRCYPELPMKLYTWASVIPNKAESDCHLEPGWFNFKPVKRGERVAVCNDKPVYSPEDGRIVFPYYPSPVTPVAPSELCRIIKRIEARELPPV